MFRLKAQISVLNLKDESVNQVPFICSVVFDFIYLTMLFLFASFVVVSLYGRNNLVFLRVP